MRPPLTLPPPLGGGEVSPNRAKRAKAAKAAKGAKAAIITEQKSRPKPPHLHMCRVMPGP